MRLYTNTRACGARQCCKMVIHIAYFALVLLGSVLALAILLDMHREHINILPARNLKALNAVDKLVFPAEETANTNLSGDGKSGEQINRVNFSRPNTTANILQVIPRSLRKETIQTAARHRGETLRTTCEAVYGTIPRPEVPPPSTDRFLYVNDEHRLVICTIPKVASSNVKRTLLVLEGAVNTNDPSNVSVDTLQSNLGKVRRLRQFPDEDILRRLREYRKVIIVREPLERLVSAYNNKLKSVNSDGSDKSFIHRKRKIMKRLHVLKKSGSVRAYNLTFAQFIKNIFLQCRSGRYCDQHWSKFTDLCAPCHVMYDYVVKYETISEDMRFILRDIGARSDIRFPHSIQKEGSLSTADILRDYYKMVPQEDIERLKELFRNDAFLFGYKFPNVVGKT